MSISVLVADDQPLHGAGISYLLDAASDVDVVGQATICTAVTAVARHRPDVVVIDLPHERLSLISELLERGAGRVILVPATCPATLLRDALLAGATGCLLKATAPAALLNVVRTVVVTGTWIDPLIIEDLLRILSGVPTAGDLSNGLDPLTPRELDVLLLVAQGLSNAEIADRLCISPLTVRTHVGRVLTKMGVRNRAHAVTTAYRTGLVRISPV